MLSTLGVILMASVGLVSSLTTWIILRASLARRVRSLLKQGLAASSATSSPQKWELRLRELADEVVSLSSSFEKMQRQLLKLSSRAGMRELRARDDEPPAPPPGASKAELRKHYGLGQDGPEFARRQLSMIPKE